MTYIKKTQNSKVETLEALQSQSGVWGTVSTVCLSEDSVGKKTMASLYLIL